MVYIYTDNVQNEITFYFDNKIYRLSNSENNDGIETVKFSAISNTSPKIKISKFNSSSFSMPRFITSDKTPKRRSVHAIQPKLQIASALFDFTG